MDVYEAIEGTTCGQFNNFNLPINAEMKGVIFNPFKI